MKCDEGNDESLGALQNDLICTSQLPIGLWSPFRGCFNCNPFQPLAFCPSALSCSTPVRHVVYSRLAFPRDLLSHPTGSSVIDNQQLYCVTTPRGARQQPGTSTIELLSSLIYDTIILPHAILEG